MKYFTSDLHFGHRRIISLSNRPYDNVEEMDECMLKTINTKVQPTDELWILGDVCMGTLDHTLSLVERIICPVTIVAGNHDRCHPVNGDKHLAWIDRYRNLSSVSELHLGATTLEIGGVTVNVNHFPYTADFFDGTKFDPYRCVDDGSTWILHGHVHGAWLQRGRQINVGIDAWGGRLVPETILAEMIAEDGEFDIPAITWEDKLPWEARVKDLT